MTSELDLPARILLGPGPSNVHPRVYKALSSQVVGHIDPSFATVMDETMGLLRAVFQTENTLTIPISGTGSAGMEAAFCNLVEPGDIVIIGVNGLFGERMADVAERCGAYVVPVRAEWGDVVEPAEVERALSAHSKVKLVAVVQAETSTGVLQPLDDISRLAKRHEALFLVDAVTSLGGVEVTVDRTGIDACYGGTQKCLSCPPGLAPLTFNENARAVLQRRTRKVQSWYLDLTMIENYWGTGRVYHHTAPVSMIYGLREALRLIVEEGLERRFERHRTLASALKAGLQAMGLLLHAREGYQLTTLTSVRVPTGVNEARVRHKLLAEYGIEIGGGLGQLKGKIWRIGLMGYSCSLNNVVLCLSALEHALRQEGLKIASGVGVAAALDAMERSKAEMVP